MKNKLFTRRSLTNRQTFSHNINFPGQGFKIKSFFLTLFLLAAFSGAYSQEYTATSGATPINSLLNNIRLDLYVDFAGAGPGACVSFQNDGLGNDIILFSGAFEVSNKGNYYTLIRFRKTDEEEKLS